jgi:hypothetical protein
MSGTVQQSAYRVEDRLEEPEGAPVFWNESLEIFTAIVEALCEATLLVGRPTQLVNQLITIQPNTVWQTMPAGFLCITDIQGPGSQVWKWTLRDMDFLQSANGSDWEQDIFTTKQSIMRWGPVGFTQFFVWPAIPHAQQVLATGIQTPVQQGWPFSGSQAINLHDEFFQAIEKYAAHYLRLKESGSEFKDSMALYEGFLEDMKRMTAIEDRRDPYIFTRGVGAAADRGQAPVQR